MSGSWDGHENALISDVGPGGELRRTIPAPGGINGWPVATDDTIVWPIGPAEPAALVAYRLP